ncbi:hypothetical protein WICMUC_002589 [Wickerhamomyces mucosus]|uniref:NAD-dependent epimerase/dehydratase domain-containing protein n=1 Tax=Wickerhamomyces mucosus TaxID=1378264 RepID=A0A9P8PQA6_9ASCO|nr:hypothetical protein WICMUC_002589 [Wickerhamomyces mucosus]
MNRFRLLTPLVLNPNIRFQSTVVLPRDLNILSNGEIKISKGLNGRSSRTGYTATVFGSTSFLGSYVATRLAKNGTITVCPFRDDLKKRFLKVAGDLGVVNFVEFDLRNIESIKESVKYSDIVYNFIGVDYNTKNFSMADVNIEGARRIAQASKDAGVNRFIHISSYNADKDSTSIFYKTKAIGEEVVRDIIPDATIVRPSIAYGYEDQFLNRLAETFRLFTVNNSQEVINPVHVIDLAAALEKIGFDDSTIGQTFELYGPDRLNIKEIRDLIQQVTLKNYKQINVPKDLAIKVSEFLQLFWWRMVNPDQIERQFIDQKISNDVKTFANLGIEPNRLQDLVYRYTAHFRDYTHAQDLPPNVKQSRPGIKLVN